MSNKYDKKLSNNDAITMLGNGVNKKRCNNYAKTIQHDVPDKSEVVRKSDQKQTKIDNWRATRTPMDFDETVSNSGEVNLGFLTYSNLNGHQPSNSNTPGLLNDPRP